MQASAPPSPIPTAASAAACPDAPARVRVKYPIVKRSEDMRLTELEALSEMMHSFKTRIVGEKSSDLKDELIKSLQTKLMHSEFEKKRVREIYSEMIGDIGDERREGRELMSQMEKECTCGAVKKHCPEKED